MGARKVRILGNQVLYMASGCIDGGFRNKDVDPKSHIDSHGGAEVRQCLHNCHFEEETGNQITLERQLIGPPSAQRITREPETLRVSTQDLFDQSRV